MLQIAYISTARNAPNVDDILIVSRRNNARDRITGLLYSDGIRFLQVLEGPTDQVKDAFGRIQEDGRHRAIVILSCRAIEARQFGEWAMAHRPSRSEGNKLAAELGPLLRDAAPGIRATFESFARLDRAA